MPPVNCTPPSHHATNCTYAMTMAEDENGNITINCFERQAQTFKSRTRPLTELLTALHHVQSQGIQLPLP